MFNCVFFSNLVCLFVCVFPTWVSVLPSGLCRPARPLVAPWAAGVISYTLPRGTLGGERTQTSSQ